MTQIIVAAIGAFSAIVVALIGAGIVARPWVRRQAAKWAKIDSIDRAVNQVPAGQPTMVSRVGRIETCVHLQARHGRRHRIWSEQVLRGIAEHVGYQAPPPPEPPVELKGES